jgi:hypothetical protein
LARGVSAGVADRAATAAGRAVRRVARCRGSFGVATLVVAGFAAGRVLARAAGFTEAAALEGSADLADARFAPSPARAVRGLADAVLARALPAGFLAGAPDLRALGTALTTEAAGALTAPPFCRGAGGFAAATVLVDFLVGFESVFTAMFSAARPETFSAESHQPFCSRSRPRPGSWAWPTRHGPGVDPVAGLDAVHRLEGVVPRQTTTQLVMAFRRSDLIQPRSGQCSDQVSR